MEIPVFLDKLLRLSRASTPAPHNMLNTHSTRRNTMYVCPLLCWYPDHYQQRVKAGSGGGGGGGGGDGVSIDNYGGSLPRPHFLPTLAFINTGMNSGPRSAGERPRYSPRRPRQSLHAKFNGPTEPPLREVCAH